MLDERELSLREAAERSGWSKSAIHNARKGPRLPNPDLVAAVLQVAGLSKDQIQDWTLRHASLAKQAKTPPDDDVDGGPTQPKLARRGRTALAAGALAIAAMVVGGWVGYVVGSSHEQLPIPSTATSAVVTVQNKSAMGASELVEDSTPSYLSARPQPFCASNGCKLDGAEIVSGALLPATCVTRGPMMWNYNLDSPAAENPNRVASDLWYRLSWPDGRTGYLSEVYVEPPYRGGLRLSSC